VDEVVISFAQIYKKTDRNLNKAARDHGFNWWDPPEEEKKQLASELVEIARSNHLRLSLCAQRELLVPGAEDARCIDADRLTDVAGSPIEAGSKGHRKTCGCCQSRDIGAYNTCPHGCVYCTRWRTRRWRSRDSGITNWLRSRCRSIGTGADYDLFFLNGPFSFDAKIPHRDTLLERLAKTAWKGFPGEGRRRFVSRSGPFHPLSFIR
jgi:hypothetical protein